MIFNERLKELRKEKGLTQMEAARALGVNYRHYQRLEADGNTPNFSNLVQIADLFDVSMDYLAGRTGRREVNREMRHTVIFSADAAVPAGMEERLEQVIAAALSEEGVGLPCEIDVLMTGDEGIRQINREQRGVDRPTDVLSFPMFELTPGEHPGREDADPETGLAPLGDMVISLERARAQAAEYGHSLEREVCYLAVHSVLHLLGYDHMDEGPGKQQMREREEAILGRLGITREGAE
ncbi:MAG: rRNA maturation RNase YbeY [Lawsonibacter sp.]|nr:rRNA maturation RNase YbeY [Lawsonibacter sp.]